MRVLRALGGSRDEMRRRGVVMREISAYELIEGCDPTLCNSFAEFCAQYIAVTRMQNPSSAMYVSQSAAAVGSHKTKIALNRLVAAACRYLSWAPAPSSTREVYFSSRGYAPYMVVQQRFVNRGGWQQLVPAMGI